MNERILSVEEVGGFVLRIQFGDGVEGEIDFSEELDGENFEPLRDTEYFSKVEIHPLFGALVWPNGADFAPEYLYSCLKAPV
jgi:hypothetical protein